MEMAKAVLNATVTTEEMLPRGALHAGFVLGYFRAMSGRQHSQSGGGSQHFTCRPGPVEILTRT